MKRALGLVIVIAAVVAGFLSIRGAMPFMAILGNSMEPEFKAGDLIIIEEVSPSEIEVGDVIVFTVPPLVREAYNYPQVVVHRVARAYTTERGTTFRTRGDNASGEDPFMVRSQDINGEPGKRIRYLGFPLLFLQSRHGLIFTIVGLCLFAWYLYAEELSRGSGKAQRGLFAPVIEENRRSSRLLEQRIETTEKVMAGTGQALGKFTSAIEVYAEHLSSHTSAIQGLSEASQELKQSAVEQNKVLAHLTKVMEQIAPRREEKARAQAEEITAEAEGSCQERVPIAEQQAQCIIKTVEELNAVAEEKATRTVSEARQEAEELAGKIVAFAEEQGQSILSKEDDNADEMEEKAEREVLTALVAVAEEEATRTVSEARQEAEELAGKIVASAEEQGQSILSKADDNANEIKEKAERVVLTVLVHMVNDTSPPR